MANEYNGWANKETWLVNVWYMDFMEDYYADVEQYHVEPDQLQEQVEYLTEKCESLSSLPVGLLSDFINTCFARVDWHELAEHLNVTLAEMEKELE